MEREIATGSLLKSSPKPVGREGIKDVGLKLNSSLALTMEHVEACSRENKANVMHLLFRDDYKAKEEIFIN